LIKCIAGLKGSGKTKQLVAMVNAAVNEDSGSVICIEKDPKLTYDVNSNCRLIHTSEYDISSYPEFFGFICGLYAQNYDITSIFVDGLYKIAGNDEESANEFIVKLEKFSEQTGIKFVMTVSVEVENAPEQVKKYL